MDLEKLYLTIINSLCDGVYYVDKDRRITFWNKAAENITGYTEDEILGQCCQDNLLNHIDSEGCALCLTGCPLYKTIIDGNQRKVELFLRHKEGYRIPVFVNIVPIENKGEIIGAAEIFTPNFSVVYKDDLIEKLTSMAMNDHLTGVANRRKMQSNIEYKLNELRRFNQKFCVIFFDFDDFKTFNNTYGHEAGDIILKNITKSINVNIRESDSLGRWGGEEFIGVFAIKNDDEAILIAEKIRMLIMRTEITHDGKKLSITASFGVTVGLDRDTPDTIVKRADLLMHESKKNNKNQITLG